MADRLTAIIAGDFESAEVLLDAAGFRSGGFVRDAGGALALLGRVQADLLLADAVLPGMDGPGLAEAVFDLPLWVRPTVVIAAPRGLSVPGADRLRSVNAALVEKPVSPEALSDAYRALREAPPGLPPDRAARLSALLDALGVPEHPGRRALAEAVALVWLDGRMRSAMRRALYPAVGRATGLTPAQVERAIGHAIDAAWRTSAMEAQDRIFGDTIDAKRGRPTGGEMIARLADILRWEGRQ